MNESNKWMKMNEKVNEWINLIKWIKLINEWVHTSN